MTTPPITALDREAAALLPCPNPWCHSHERGLPLTRLGITETFIPHGRIGFRVRCSDCGIVGPTVERKAEAYPAWNTRTAAERATSPAGDAGEVERVETSVEMAKRRSKAREESGLAYVEGSIYEGMEACVVRSGKTLAQVWKYGDAVEIVEALNGLPPSVAELVEALRGVRDWLTSAPLESGYCCCGSPVESHGMGDGHSPVDELAYSAAGQVERIAALLPQAGDADVVGEPGALAYLESEARRFADAYPEGSDGRNTFVIFADKIAALAAPEQQEPGA